MKINEKIVLLLLLIVLSPSFLYVLSLSLDRTQIFFLVITNVFLIILTLAYLLKMFSKPILLISEAIKKMQEGNLSHRITITSKDEIGQLADAINIMAGKLQESHTLLEREIKIKNSALEKTIADLEKINSSMIRRELRMLELKGKVAQLKERLGDQEHSTPPLSSLSPQTMELNKAITADEIREAFMNVLQDLEQNKTQIEEKKILDDAILASIGEGLIATDNNGKIFLINRVGAEMIGWDSNEANGKLVQEVFPLAYRTGKPMPQNDYPVFVALASGKKVTSASDHFISAIRKDKIMFPAAMVVTPIFVTTAGTLEKKKLVGALTIFRDMSREKEVDRMKTEFISLASHQLRTPLSAIKWFSEMLLDGDAGEMNKDQKELLDSIHQSNLRMISLVNALLNISRIESGRIIIDPKPTNLGELVSEVINELKPKLEEKKHKLVVSIHEKLPIVSIDPKLIRQVYQNLLTNAIKYTPIGGEITVFLSTRDDEIISQVSDNGYGIPKSQEDKVFQKFFRAENIVRIETDGTGLGLYLVKAIIESSQGKIWFKSEVGQGTTFWFSLPLSGVPPQKGEVTLDSKMN